MKEQTHNPARTIRFLEDLMGALRLSTFALSKAAAGTIEPSSPLGKSLEQIAYKLQTACIIAGQEVEQLRSDAENAPAPKQGGDKNRPRTKAKRARK
jgi:hypothetical protein